MLRFLIAIVVGSFAGNFGKRLVSVVDIVVVGIALADIVPVDTVAVDIGKCFEFGMQQYFVVQTIVVLDIVLTMEHLTRMGYPKVVARTSLAIVLGH